MTGYCVKCKTKREIQEAKEASFKGKGGKERWMLKGKCPVCGTTMCRILPSKKTEENIQETKQEIKIEEKQETKQEVKPSIEKEINEWDKVI